MSLIREGIENVRVVALPDGVASDGRSAVVSRSALVTWRSSNAGLFHQVYVNGRFAGVTVDAEQRRLVVYTPCSLHAAVRITVVAVEPTEAHIDFADELEPSAGERVRLILLRSQTLPIGVRANIYCDNGTGQIDYAAPLSASPVAIWPYVQDKAGFGTAGFGEGDFGWDSAAAAGFGSGAFGQGQFGLDADTIEWISPVLPLGRYRFGVRITDASGAEGPAGETEPITIVAAATPAAALRVASFDEQTYQLTLSVTQGESDG